MTPNGLDAKDEQGEHHTTAYDLCRIMSYCAWKSPVSKQFLEVTQTRSHTFQSLEGTGYAVSNKNALLDMMDHVITGKTGYISKPRILHNVSPFFKCSHIAISGFGRISGFSGNHMIHHIQQGIFIGNSISGSLQALKCM